MTVQVTGLAATSSLGDVTTVSKATVTLVGLEITTGTPQVLVWGIIDDAQDPSWTGVTDTQDPSWTGVDDTQDPNWEDVA
jgi:hypothetical protein